MAAPVELVEKMRKILAKMDWQAADKHITVEELGKTFIHARTTCLEQSEGKSIYNEQAFIGKIYARSGGRYSYQDVQDAFKATGYQIDTLKCGHLVRRA